MSLPKFHPGDRVRLQTPAMQEDGISLAGTVLAVHGYLDGLQGCDVRFDGELGQKEISNSVLTREGWR